MLLFRNPAIVDRRNLDEADYALASELQKAKSLPELLKVCERYSRQQIGLACELNASADSENIDLPFYISLTAGARVSARKIARMILDRREKVSAQLSNEARTILHPAKSSRSPRPLTSPWVA